jgi:hypothetical protein
VKADIESRFFGNLDRVKHLVETYQASATGSGRRAVDTSDTLRAAVVFSHATLEDLLRSLLSWKLPSAAPAHLKDIPLSGKKPRSTFTLDDLAPFRGSTVDDLIAQSVESYLERSNFNDPGEVDQVLVRIGLTSALFDPYRDKLGPMMKRRHWIVHRADRNTAAGRGHHAARTIQQTTVEAWSDALSNFGTDVFDKL